jgi:hypothetical protein
MDVRSTTSGFRCMPTVLAAGLMLAVASPAWSQRVPEEPAYDPGTVDTICGQLVLVEGRDQTLRTGGVLLLVKRPRDLVYVHAGPSWHYRRQRVRLKMRDTVWVTGSRVTIGGTPVILAAEVQQGGRVWRLRDAAGDPVWAPR